MAILDDLMRTADEVVRNRVDRVNPGAAINRRPADNNLDWLNRSIHAAREAADERKAREEAERKRQEEERKRLEREEKRRLERERLATEAEQKMVRQRSRETKFYNPYEGTETPESQIKPASLNPYLTKPAPVERGVLGDTPAPRREERTIEDATRHWSLSPEGSTILSGGDKSYGFNIEDFALKQEKQKGRQPASRANRRDVKPEEPKNVWKALAKNRVLAEYSWGLGDPENRRILLEKGVPPEVLEGIRQYALTDEGSQQFQKIGVRDYSGPVATVVGDVTGSKTLGEMAGLAAFAIPYVGTVLGSTEAGLRPGEDEMSWQLAAEAAGVAGDAITMGKGAQIVERGVEKLLAKKYGANYLQRLGVRMVTRGTLNAAEEVPITAVYLASMGIDPTSKEGREMLALSGAMAFTTGSAIPLGSDVARAGARGTGKVLAAADKVPGGKVVVESAGAAGLAGAASDITGGDEEDNLRRAALAGLGPGALRVGRRVAGGLGDPNVARLTPDDVPAGRTTEVIQDALEPPPSVARPAVDGEVRALGEEPDLTREMTIEEFRNRMRNPQIEARPPLVDDRGLAFQLNDLFADPNARAAMAGATMGGYGYFTSDEEDQAGRIEDAALLAMLGSGRYLAGDALTRRILRGNEGLLQGIKKTSDIEDFRVGGPVRDARTGNARGKIVSVDSQTGIAKVKGKDGKVRLLQARSLLTESDYAKNTAEKARTEALKPVTPSEMVVKAREVDMDNAIEQAHVLTDNKRLMSRALGKVGLGAIDPAQKFDTPVKRRVLTAVVAAASEQRAELARSIEHVRTTLKALEPLMQETGPRFQKGFVDVSLHDLKRAGAQLGTAAAPAAAGYIASEETGDPIYKEAGVLAGLVSMASMSHAQSRGFMRQTPWDKIALNLEDPEMPSLLRKGQGKLIDILERPEMYDLSPEMRAAIEEYRLARRNFLRETNASLQAAGMPLVPELEANQLFHWFTPESIRAAGLEQAPSAVEINSPGFARALPFEQQRELGNTYYDALASQRGAKLKIAGNVPQLLQEEAKMHAARRANAVLVRALKNSDGAWRVPDYDALKEILEPDEIRALRDFEKSLRETYKFNQIPGIDDHLFHPDAVQAVSDLFVTGRGSDNAVLTLLDDATNAVRQAMFVGDASAWSMQGLMAAIEDPMAVLRNAHHLIGSTAFGNRYFNWWVSKPENARLWREYTRAGGMPSRQFEGLELETADTAAGRAIHKLGIANKPGFKQIESRGFESFLPIHRALMFDAVRKQNAFIRGLKLHRVPGAQAAVEAAKYGPLATGIGLAATGNELDIPGVDEDLDKLFTVALFGAGSMATREAIQAEGRGALERMPLKERFRVQAEAGKHVNRISGNLNRQVMGISNKQSQLERTFGFRSPALARNAVTLAKHAATDLGPEGATARMYLVKTMLLIGLGMAALKYANTGEWDSFDPRDPDSVFSPEMLLRSDLGEIGTVSPSNPIVALLRAGLYQDKPAGETRWKPENWRPDIGLSDWMKNRLPDVSGIATENLFDKFVGEGIPDPNARPDTGLLEKLKQGDTSGAAASVVGRMSPVAWQQALESGLAGQTAIGDRLGLEGEPSFNHQSERVINTIGALFGVNANPESLGKEATRLKNEKAQEMFPQLADRTGDGRIGYDDLNQEQQGRVRNALEQAGDYQDVTRRLDENREVEESSPIGDYLKRQETINEDYLTRLRAADAEYQRTGNAMEFKRTYQSLAEERRVRLKEARGALGEQSAEMRGRDETVEEWLSRNLKPEDEAVQKYYDLFDKATRADGRLNFDKLEKFQAEYLKNLDPKTRDYVNRRIQSFDKPPEVKALADYEKAKEQTAEFFDKRDELFQRFKGGDPFLSQFETLGEFEDAVEEIANQNGISADKLTETLAKTNPSFRLYQRMLKLEEKTTRMTDSELDASLSTWFGYRPVSPVLKATQDIDALATALSLLSAPNEFRQYDFGMSDRRYRRE